MGASQSSPASLSPASLSPASPLTPSSLSPASLSPSPSKSALCNFSADQIRKFKDEISKLDEERSAQKLEFATVIEPLKKQLAADGVNVTNLELEMNRGNRHALLQNEMIAKHATIVNAILYSELISILKGYNVFLLQFASICKTCDIKFDVKGIVEQYLTPVLAKARFFIEDYGKGGELGSELKDRYVSVTSDFLNKFDTEDPAKTIEYAMKEICAAKSAAVEARVAARQGGNKPRQGDNKRPSSRSRSLPKIRLYSKIKRKTKRNKNNRNKK
jgi:hypothetical protein